MKKIISDCATGLVSFVEMTDAEVAAVETMKKNNIQSEPAPAPTKEQLLAEVQALLAKIEAVA